jgi:hypothetical protein
MDNNELIERVAPVWCQHCKAMQKINKTVVECWYNPLTEMGDHAFCASCLDALNGLFHLLNGCGVRVFTEVPVGTTIHPASTDLICLYGQWGTVKPLPEAKEE